MKNILKESSLNELRRKILRNKSPLNPETHIYTRKQDKGRINKENNEWTEDYITIPKESRLEKDKLDTEKYCNISQRTSSLNRKS